MEKEFLLRIRSIDVFRATYSLISATEFKRSRKSKIRKALEGGLMSSAGESWQQMAGAVRRSG